MLGPRYQMDEIGMRYERVRECFTTVCGELLFGAIHEQKQPFESLSYPKKYFVLKQLAYHDNHVKATDP